MRHLQTMDCELDLPWFRYGYRKCVFVDFLTGHMGHPDCDHYGVQNNV